MLGGPGSSMAGADALGAGDLDWVRAVDAARDAARRTCAAAGETKATCWNSMKAAVRTASRGRRAEAQRLPPGNEVGTYSESFLGLDALRGGCPDSRAGRRARRGESRCKGFIGWAARRQAGGPDAARASVRARGWRSARGIRWS